MRKLLESSGYDYICGSDIINMGSAEIYRVIIRAKGN